MGLKNYDEAILSCDKALKLDSNQIEAYVNKIEALNELKLYKDAIETCDLAITIDPKSKEL